MNESHESSDLPRDAWLREALRHAPDAEAAPPPKLNETILRMGRAAVAPRIERAPAAVNSGTLREGGGAPGPLAALWAWLARPPVAAGFAAVFLCTVAGVVWMGDSPDENDAAPREEVVAAAPPAPVTPAPATPAPATAPAETRAPEAARRVAEKPAPAIVAAAPARKVEAQQPPPVVAAAPAPPAPATAAPAAAEMATRDSARAERREAAAAGMAAATAAAAPAPAASAVETPSLSNLRFEIRRKAEAWSWQRDDGESRAMDDAMQNWIAQADRASRPSWQHGAAAGATTSTTLRFTRDGVTRAVLRLGPNGMQLTRGGKTESVALSAGQMGALQSSLDALGP
ncbi:hypothetical protein [Piscinibacter sp.]|uniref:hypothetical protein n=1 Tax=Piscinibacter sp. TaxID=1903157 RepID=UPI0039E5A78D